jgi:hypothetical protein
MSTLQLTQLLSINDDSKSEGKEVRKDPPSLPEGLSALLKASAPMFSISNKSYTIEMTRTATLVSSGGGTMALVTLIYPSQFDQYNQVSALFGECRIRSTSIQLANAGGGVLSSSFMVAFDPHAVNGATTSTSSVNRLLGAKLYNATLQTNWPITMSYRYPKSMTWATVSSTASGSDPLSSVKGGWCNVAMNTVTATANYLQYRISAVYDFRCQL